MTSSGAEAMTEGLMMARMPSNRSRHGNNQNTMPTRPILAAVARLASWVSAPRMSIAERMNISQEINTFGINARMAPKSSDPTPTIGKLGRMPEICLPWASWICMPCIFS